MDFVLRKICVSYGTIKKISKHLDKKTLLVLYNSLIISHIRYCITTWHIGNKTTASKIQRIANKFIRMTFGLHQFSSVQFSFISAPPHEQNNKMLKSLCVDKDGVRKRKKQQNELTLCLAN